MSERDLAFAFYMNQTIFNLHKPKGPTSFNIVAQVRKITGVKKVGHAGTLDPLASGVLVIGVTREGTKQMHTLVKEGKEYIATIKLGQTSTTDDEEGEKTIVASSEEIKNVTKENVESILPKFTGDIEQIPPLYSAIKVKGKSAYKYAREGKELELAPRQVKINEIEILTYEPPVLKLRVATGSGVYIRSLARDIGEELKIGAYLADLVRTRVGDFVLEDSMTIEAFAEYWESGH